MPANKFRYDVFNGNVEDDNGNVDVDNGNVFDNANGNDVDNGNVVENVKSYGGVDNAGEPDFGLLFDVDGVIGRGSKPLEPAVQMIRKCVDQNNKLKVPLAFVTNSCARSIDKANMLTRWLGVEINPDQVIHAQSALSVFKRYHDKHVLMIGQGKIREIAADLGFKHICTIDDVKDNYPLLDIVDHMNRVTLATKGWTEKNDLPRIEAIVMVGEPNRWESNLQLLIDILLTDGLPNTTPKTYPEKHIPILAANMDLVFMAEACMPRFGHGAFLTCLEALYKKITGRDLEYTALVGKPSEITMRYAEHVINYQAKKLGIKKPIKTLYLVGDNDEVDIVGANLYDRYIKAIGPEDTETGSSLTLTSSRHIPEDVEFTPQTVTKCVSVLVGTGVYKPPVEGEENNNDDSDAVDVYHGHRDFTQEPLLKKPVKFAENVYEAVSWALEQEQFA